MRWIDTLSMKNMIELLAQSRFDWRQNPCFTRELFQLDLQLLSKRMVTPRNDDGVFTEKRLLSDYDT